MKIKPVGGLLSWANSHPTTTTLLTLLFFAVVPITIGSNENWASNPYAWAIGAGIVFGGGGAWFKALLRNSRNLIVAALLIAAFAIKAKEPKPAAAIAVGVIVVCVGGVCVYKLVKTCQKVFPPKSTNTNSPPEQVAASGVDEYAGAYEYSSIGSCWIPPTLNSFPYEVTNSNPTTFTLNIRVLGGSTLTTMTANSQEGITQDWTQFVADMAEHGLFLTGHSRWLPQYALNGVPCEGAEVPLSFDQLTGRVIQPGVDLRRVTIERSPNLTDWSPLMVTDVGHGTGFQVVDTTREGQMFYRVSVSQP